MSTNHRERIERVVDKAIKQAAMGEPYGFYVSTPAIWPVNGPDGQQMVNQETGEKVALPAWFVGVSIRGAGLTDPDIGNGFPVYGILPDDESFIQVARGLYDRCVRDRDQANTDAILQGALSGDEVLRRMRDGKDAA